MTTRPVLQALEDGVSAVNGADVKHILQVRLVHMRRMRPLLTANDATACCD